MDADTCVSKACWRNASFLYIFNSSPPPPPPLYWPRKFNSNLFHVMELAHLIMYSGCWTSYDSGYRAFSGCLFLCMCMRGREKRTSEREQMLLKSPIIIAVIEKKNYYDAYSLFKKEWEVQKFWLPFAPLCLVGIHQSVLFFLFITKLSIPTSQKSPVFHFLNQASFLLFPRESLPQIQWW